MQEVNLFKIFTERFNKLNIAYAVTGSVASIIYGEPRVTHDIDIVLILPEIKIEKFIKSFPTNKFYVSPVEIIKKEIKREMRGHCNIIHQETGFKADIYFAGENELQNWAIEKSKEISFAGSKIMIAPPEYVIIKKLEFFKEGHSQKHINDIKAIINNSKEMINFVFLNRLLAEFKLEEVWKKEVVVNDK